MLGEHRRGNEGIGSNREYKYTTKTNTANATDDLLIPSELFVVDEQFLALPVLFRVKLLEESGHQHLWLYSALESAFVVTRANDNPSDLATVFLGFVVTLLIARFFQLEIPV